MSVPTTPQHVGEFHPLPAYLMPSSRKANSPLLLSVPWLGILIIAIGIGIITLLLATTRRGQLKRSSSMISPSPVPANPEHVDQAFFASLPHSALSVGPLMSSNDKACDGYPYSVGGIVQKVQPEAANELIYVALGRSGEAQPLFYAAVSTGRSRSPLTTCKTAVRLLPPHEVNLMPNQVRVGMQVNLVLVDDEATMSFTANGLPIAASIALPPP